MILTDNETKVDLLNNEAIAKTIVGLLRERPERPVTVGVHGDWGAGKSSVLEMIEAGFETEDRVLCLKFNGWRFQGFEDAKIALIEGIVTGLLEKRPALTKASDTVKAVLRRVDWLKAAKQAGGLAFTAFTGIPTADQIQGIAGALEQFATNPGELATKDNLIAAADTVKALIRPDDETTSVPEEINGFRKAFDDLLDAADIDQLVVLIDDLDRCLPDTAIETLEAVRLFVFTSRTAFIVAADEAMIEYSVRKHFPDLPDTTGPQTYARNYLEKLIQVPFRIPALGESETRTYVTLLFIGAAIGENDPAFNQLIAAARELLKRPWKSGSLDAATIKSALGEKAKDAQNALTLSDQIGPILASGTKGNPRQIKRFLNTLVLRQQMAKARGFGEDVKLPVLAKLMLAERFRPRLYGQIAAATAASVDGKCADLAALEKAAIENDKSDAGTKKLAAAKDQSGSGDGKTVSRREPEQLQSSARLDEWLSSPADLAWATVKPEISDEDLRPYLFVSKDRKDYFGPASVLGHLGVIVEQLFGPKLAVQGIESDLKRLAPAEAAQVFEAVRAKIVAGGRFNTVPDGVAGLVVLVKAHPDLQGALLDFLEGLPVDHLGPWVCAGWEGVIVEAETNLRFNGLLQSWSKDGGKTLKAAATGILRARQGRR